MKFLHYLIALLLISFLTSCLNTRNQFAFSQGSHGKNKVIKSNDTSIEDKLSESYKINEQKNQIEPKVDYEVKENFSIKMVVAIDTIIDTVRKTKLTNSTALVLEEIENTKTSITRNKANNR